jgi:predicted permease
MRSFFAVDWRDALRSLRATPVVTAVAVVSLALGIGANTALFSILNSLILKTLPVRDPGQLVVIDGGSWTNPIWNAISPDRRRIFDDAFAWSTNRFDLSTHGETDFVEGAWASGGMFEVLGVHAMIGRTFTEADDDRGGGPDGPVAVISSGFWQRRLGGRPDVVGQRLTINRLPVTIVGVTPPEFFGVDVGRVADVTLPINTRALMPNGARVLDGRSTWWLEIMGRLKPGQTMEQTQAALRGAQPSIRAATLPSDWPAKDLAGYLKEPFELISAATGESNLRGGYEKPLKVILVVVGVVLVIACANIANLLLARAAARRREFSLRLALGASRLRLARQLLAESLVLGVGGALLGIGVAQLGSALLVRQLATPTSGVTLDLALDWRVLAFTAVVALATSLIFGLAPAAGVSGVAPHEALKAEARGVIGDRRWSLKNVLVIGQVALSLSLVVAAALFLRTFSALTTSDLGFTPDPLLTASLLAPPTVAVGDRASYFERIRESAGAVPGVARASLSALTPIGTSRWNTRIEVPPGGPALSPRERTAWVNVVSPGWFATFGMRVVAGRDIDARDLKGSARVIVVNESFARRIFPDRPAVGQRVTTSLEGPESHAYDVIGVVNDAVYQSVRAGFEPTVYVPLTQLGSPGPGVVLTVAAASGSPESLSHSVGRAISSVDTAAAFTIQPLGAQVRSSTRQARLVAILGGFFGGLALVLAALGLYGVTSYSVNRRRGEIGVRMALGANPAVILRLVMSRISWIMGAGVVMGAALSWWASQYVAALLFGLGPRDPATFATAAAALVIAGSLAGWLPARRAARMDPVSVLREG